MGTVILTIIGALLAAFTLFVVIVVILLLSDLLKITHFQMWQRLKKPPFSKFFWKNVIGLLILIGFCVFMFWGTNSYPELGYQLIKETDKVLIKHGICSDSLNNVDCQQYRLQYRGSSGDYALLHFYQMEKIHQEVIEEIIARCFNAYNQKNHKKTVELNFYQETKDQQTRWFSGVEPMIHIIFKGEN